MLFYDVIKDTHVNISVSEAAGGANSDGWNHSSKRQRLAHNHTYSSKPSYPDEASCESSEDAYRSQCRSGNGTWLSVSTSATSISGSSGTSPTPTHVSPLASLSPACIDTGSKDAEYYLFCYGMLPSLTLHSSKHVDTHQFISKDVSLQNRGSSLWVVDSSNGEEIARLGDRDTIILDSLTSLDAVELQCDIIPSERTYQGLNTQHTSRRSKSLGKRKEPCVLSVVIYGPWKWAESLGDYLTTRNEYLQIPTRANRNVKYLNPQSLSVNVDDAPLTFTLGSDCAFQESLDATARPDLSAQLETISDLPQTLPCACIHVELYRHQKQALTFMQRREQGWNFSKQNKDIWQRRYERIDDYASLEQQPTSYDRSNVRSTFYNVVTRQTLVTEPMQFKGGILADPMGLGKTLSIISLLGSDQLSSARVQTLIVVPLSLLQTWEDQLQQYVVPGALKWLIYHPSRGQLPPQEVISECNIVITSYDVVSAQWKRAAKTVQPLFWIKWHRLVLDEAHEIRSPSTLRAQAVSHLKSEIRWAVTGTPIQNSMDDLASVLLFLKVFPDLSHSALKRICRSIASDTAIKEALTYLCLRRPRNVITLPERRDIVKYIKFGHDEAEEYKAVNTDVVDLLSGMHHSNTSKPYPDVLVKINTLRQICNLGIEYRRKRRIPGMTEPSHSAAFDRLLAEMLSSGAARCLSCGSDIVDSAAQEYKDTEQEEFVSIAPCGAVVCSYCSKPKEVADDFKCSCCNGIPCTFSRVILAQVGQFEHVDALRTISSKVRALVESVDATPPTDKVLVFSFWTTTLDMVEQALKLSDIHATRVDGSMGSKQRQASINDFNTDPTLRVLLMSLRCGCNGLNLTAANHVFLMEPQWNPMQEEQALSRVHRIGQTKPVYTTRLVVAGTFEENVRQLQEKKRSLVEQLFGASKRGQGWVERMQSLTRESIDV